MQQHRGSELISGWPDESREAAQLVIEKYGEPRGERVAPRVASRWPGEADPPRDFYEHAFPAPRYDSVESVLDDAVPPEYASRLADLERAVQEGQERSGT